MNLKVFEAANSITDWCNAQARVKKCCGGPIHPKRTVQDVWRLWYEGFQGRISCLNLLCGYSYIWDPRTNLKEKIRHVEVQPGYLPHYSF